MRKSVVFEVAIGSEYIGGSPGVRLRIAAPAA
jgi:hypothetical protein